jgi:hypothetical protein
LSGIVITANFTENSNLPLDDRTVVADNTARDAIVSGRRFIGLEVFVVATAKKWRLDAGITNADWIEMAGAATGTGSPTIFGTYAVGRSVDPLVGVTVAAAHMSNSAINQRVFIVSTTAGAVTDLDSGLAKQLDDGTVVGQQLTLIGTSDTAVLRFLNGQGLNLNGDDWVSFNKKRLTVEWDGSIWVEISRRD